MYCLADGKRNIYFAILWVEDNVRRLGQPRGIVWKPAKKNTEAGEREVHLSRWGSVSLPPSTWIMSHACVCTKGLYGSTRSIKSEFVGRFIFLHIHIKYNKTTYVKKKNSTESPEFFHLHTHQMGFLINLTMPLKFSFLIFQQIGRAGSFQTIAKSWQKLCPRAHFWLA